MAACRFLVLGGDGVGPEVVAEAVRVGEWLAAHRGVALSFTEAPYGMRAWRSVGAILPAPTLAAARSADAILFGAIGDYRDLPMATRREGSILRLRTELRLFANLRPVRWWPALRDSSPLRPEVGAGTDLLIVRENTGGLYFGMPRSLETMAGGGRRAVNTLSYTTDEIERIARFAFTLARGRANRLCSVDKSNVLENGLLWRETVTALHEREFPDVALSHLLVDHCAMQLVRAPDRFDVIVTDNLFGDILSDGAGAIVGSLGLLPSASLGHRNLEGRRKALYEPVHGSAPDIAGRGIANPVGAILSLAMAMRHSAEDEDAARRIEQAVGQAFADGARTPDIAASGGPAPVGTREMADAVIAALARQPAASAPG